MAYIGRPLNAGNLAVQSGTGDGSDTTPIATLNYATTTNGIAVYLDGVRQLAGTDYNVTSQTTLTFTTAPANGVGVDVYFLGLEVSIPTPADSSISTAKIANNAVDETKLKDALIGDFTDVTVTASDTFLYGDATDSGNTKRDTVQGILDLAGGGARTLLSTTSISSSSSSVDITANIDGTYKIYEFTMNNIVASTANNMALRVQVGGSWISTSSYSYRDIGLLPSVSTYYSGGSTSGTSMSIGNVRENTNSANTYAIFRMYDPANASTATGFEGFIAYAEASDVRKTLFSGGYQVGATVTGVQFLPSSGTFNAGEIKLYGIS